LLSYAILLLGKPRDSVGVFAVCWQWYLLVPQVHEVKAECEVRFSPVPGLGLSGTTPEAHSSLRIRIWRVLNRNALFDVRLVQGTPVGVHRLNLLFLKDPELQRQRRAPRSIELAWGSRRYSYAIRA